MQTVVCGQRIGQGAFGCVYDVHGDPSLAIKVVTSKSLLPDIPESEMMAAASKLFDRGAAPLFVRVYPRQVLYQGLWKPKVYDEMVMEKFREGTLEDILEREREDFGVAFTRNAAFQMAWGVAMMHQEGDIGHRDLKAANIMVQHSARSDRICVFEIEGRTWAVSMQNRQFLKLVDFGMASYGCYKDRTSSPSEFKGSPVAMSPEVLVNDLYAMMPVATEDLWALAVLFLEIGLSQWKPAGRKERFGQWRSSYDPVNVSAVSIFDMLLSVNTGAIRIVVREMVRCLPECIQRFWVGSNRDVPVVLVSTMFLNKALGNGLLPPIASSEPEMMRAARMCAPRIESLYPGQDLFDDAVAFLTKMHGELFVGLLREMFAWNPERRLDEFGILDHPYFDVYKQCAAAVADKNVVVRRFGVKSK